MTRRSPLRRRLPLGSLAALLLSVACKDTNQPTSGALRASVSTAGGDLDLDGYAVAVDTFPSQPIGVNQAVVIPELPTGAHDVQLSGVAQNCTLAGQNPRSVSVITADTVETTFAVTCRATGVQVTTITAGLDVDLDGYAVAVDGGSPQAIGVNATQAVTRLSAGTHTVALSGAAANCAIGGANPQSVSITAGEMAPVAFAVTCGAITGAIQVAAATSGLDLDANGYTVQLDGGAPRALNANGLVTITGVAGGDHVVTLAGADANCAPAGSNPRTVQVTTGGTTRDTVRTTFEVTCVATTGVIEVTTVTSGSDLDPNGYYIQVDISTGASTIAANGTVHFAGVSGGSHHVRFGVEYMFYNCTLSGENPRTLSVTTGSVTRDTVRTTFEITCAALGSIEVTTRTTGLDLDPNGYGIDAYPILPTTYASVDAPANGTVTIPDLVAGDYTVYLDRGVSMNCDVVGPSWRTVSVPSGGTAAVQFDVTCAQAAQLAVSLWVNGSYDIYTLKSNGAGLTRLTTDPAPDFGPAWSPDGTRIAFWSDRDGNHEIYVMNQDGSGITRLTNVPNGDFGPRWSPDGSKIAFMSERDANSEIYVMNADGSGVTRLTTNTVDDMWPAWSPDGSKIAFMSARDGEGEIYVMNPDGSGVTPLTTNTVDDTRPEWSPDGTKLVFARFTEPCNGFEEWDLYVMNADGSGAAQLTSGSNDNHAAWSPDGGWIAFTASFFDHANGCDYSYSAVQFVPTDGSRVVELLRDAFYPAWRP